MKETEWRSIVLWRGLAELAEKYLRRALRRSSKRDEKDLPDVYCNAQMPSRMVHEVCRLQPQGLPLSARAYDRILKVARTAADLSGSAVPSPRDG